MKEADLRSALADPIRRFVEYKRALNRKYRPEMAALRLFDRYLYENDITGWSGIDGILIEGFLRSRPRTRPRSYNHLLGVLHRFFDWALVQRFAAINPVTAARRRDTGKRIPYLFDIKDAKRLLEVVRTLPDQSRAPHRAQTYETIFALLYGLGLRVGEAARLKLGDLNFQRDTLLIRETKFSKSRIVPFGPKLGARLRRYVKERHGEEPESDRPLFSFTKRGCISPETVSQTFHALLPKLGLHLPSGVSPPRLHDLRHAFAVGTLLRWYRQGIDPNCRLIHLSTFLGHVDPNSTAVYLTITDELLREADRRFRAFALRSDWRQQMSCTLGQVVFAFFEDHLKVQKGLRPGSISSYRDTLKLFLIHVGNLCRRPVARLALADLAFERVLDFLRMIEKTRSNQARTRNQRLAALRTFYRYVATHYPEMLAEGTASGSHPNQTRPAAQNRLYGAR